MAQVALPSQEPDPVEVRVVLFTSLTIGVVAVNVGEPPPEIVAVIGKLFNIMVPAASAVTVTSIASTEPVVRIAPVVVATVNVGFETTNICVGATFVAPGVTVAMVEPLLNV